MSKGTSNNAEHEYEQENQQQCQVGTPSMNDAICHKLKEVTRENKNGEKKGGKRKEKKNNNANEIAKHN